MSLIDKTVSSLTIANTAESGLKLAEAAATRAAGAATTAAISMGLRTLQEASGMRFDPAPAYLFFVELSGVFVALFTECGGLQVQRAVEPVQEGGVNNYTHKLPGRLEFSNITLKRGLSLSRGLWDWMMQGRYDSRVRRINFSIIQGAPSHNLATLIGDAAGVDNSTFFTVMGQGFGKVKHWDIENAYPVKWEMSSLNASSKNAAIETLEIAHHGMSLSYEVLTPMSLAGGGGDAI
jgi:phage tail-like protein